MSHGDFGFVHQVLTYTRIREESQRAFSERYNTYLPNRIDRLLKFGPAVLSQDELSALFKDRLATYYQYLVGEVAPCVWTECSIL